MKFTIIIEFVVSGIIILFAFFVLFVFFEYDSLHGLVETGKQLVYLFSWVNNLDSRIVGIPIAAIFLSIAYAIGIITNMLLLILQQLLLIPFVRKQVLTNYLKYGELPKVKLIKLFPNKFLKDFRSAIINRECTSKLFLFNWWKRRNLLNIFFGRIRLIFDSKQN